MNRVTLRAVALLRSPSGSRWVARDFHSTPGLPAVSVFQRQMATVEHPPVLRDLLKANEKYSAGFCKGALPLLPGKKVTVLACMDARLDPARALGLEEGDAHVIRNAGGRAKDALRSLIISQQLLGTKHVIVLHHTNCGMVTFTNDKMRSLLKERFGHESKDDFLPFSDDKDAVLEDVEIIKSSAFVPKDITVHGFLYDVKTGKLLEVKAGSQATEANGA